MIIGLTGGIASGKSLIANEIKAYNIPVIDADYIAKEVVEPGEAAYEKVVEEFGVGILEKDGTIARKELGRLVFGDEKKRQILNQIMHPAIRQRMIEKKKHYQTQGYEHVVLDIPLLIESQLQHMVDKVLLIYVDAATQKDRLIKRDQAGEEDADNRIASQMPLKDKKVHADAVIDNNGTRESSQKQLVDIFKQWNIL
ncbi:dephospho-CoA kinase [Alteribacillus persepolensis]|uniref:Dephospho-CoA kinase n=1 Tax=Alteribacillus persepolensis TaxID=568899 RepID=A0A1G8BK75_9BACI|nr:dephospho-CoA kinase [Alteribacillus persepolensis]SDH33493.1 dephospho-CoA kinase [Alteribacillus persepolensis]